MHEGRDTDNSPSPRRCVQIFGKIPQSFLLGAAFAEDSIVLPFDTEQATFRKDANRVTGQSVITGAV